ncbi:hypothetical protein [Pseudomonas palleroniana]|uniref:hypothetical protein n=1 Tax=Pseudomonas palleroniana TaxID=191390 RepID=UPI0018E6A2CA|nr:hypothetical protein [Pseudomonas palleroniana]MBI6912021.1 hypothetical protein [Pseudomonas palleroniana]
MRNSPLILSQINNSFDFSIKPLTEYHEKNHSPEIKLSTELYSRLVDKAQDEFGGELLRFSISPESYMRYKNGRVSSIVKGESGFKSHEGFEAVRMVNIVDSIFNEVNQFLTNRVMSEFQTLTNNIFSSINLVQVNLFNQALYLKEQGHVEDLTSFQDFFSEINDDLGDISASSERSSAYIGSLVSVRTKIYKTYNYFINKLQAWPASINSFDMFGNRLAIDYNSLQNDYLLCRQSINCYMIALVYEYVIAGSIDDKSCEKIVAKIQSFLTRFRNADEQIKFSLNQRDASNKAWNWYYRPDKQNDSGAIGWFLSQLQLDNNFEVTKVREVFAKSKKLLECVLIVEAKDS